MRERIKILLICLSMLLVACVGVKQSIKDAELYAQQGFHEQAFHEYQKLYEQKKNAEAFIGMNKAADGWVKESISRMQMHRSAHQYDQALDALDEIVKQIQAFQTQALQVHTEFNPDQIESEIRRMWSDDLVASIQRDLNKGDYKQADLGIRKLQSVRRSDDRIEGLQILSKVVEHYRNAEEYLKLGLNRQAYSELNEVVRRDASFADALAKRDSLNALLSYSLACVIIDNPKVSNEVEHLTINHIQSELLESAQPYVSILDRTELEVILEEQRQNMGAAFDEKLAIEAGKLAGAQYILSGRFIQYTVDVNTGKPESRYAYKGKSANFSKRVLYDHYSAEWEQEVVFSWRLTDATTGEIHRTGTIPFSNSGSTEYAEYKGDHSELYPGEVMLGIFPTPWDKVYRDARSKMEFEKLFSENFDLIPDQREMERNVFESIAREIALAVAEFIPPAS